MAILSKSRRLKKELTLLDVYVIATGTTLSTGFFLLPGLAAAQVGPALTLSYMIAAIPIVPAMLCTIELATAMPRSGGTYYFLDRSLGPWAGTIGGLGTWLALIMKTAFALVGIGAYLSLFFPNFPMKSVAVAMALLFGGLNLMGARKTSTTQMVLVAGLLCILLWFILTGLPEVNASHFAGYLDAGSASILSTAGLVYVSYVGITKVASISEEIKDPEKNLPRGVFMALVTTMAIYALGTYVMVGVVPAGELAGDLTPVATVAERLVGHWGSVMVAVAALLAFFSVANAGILSSSRYPLAMSRDHLLPSPLRALSARGTPHFSIIITVLGVLVILLLLDPVKIAKLASAFQLLMFALLCLAVIVMRESRIHSYDPGYRSPFYPGLPLLGIATSVLLIGEMGWLAIFFNAGLIGVATAWYFYYGKSRVEREGAVLHIFERLGRERFDGLDREFRSVLKKRGLRDEDPFDEVIARANVIDLNEPASFSEVVQQASELLAQRLPTTSEPLAEGFLKGTRIGATSVAGGAALLHLRLPNTSMPEIVLVRSRNAIAIETADVFEDSTSHHEVHAVFFLVSPEQDPGLHLRILAQLTEQIDQETFLPAWLEAQDEPSLKEVLLRNDRYFSVPVRQGTPTEHLAGLELRQVSFPENCLVALVRRQGETLVPRGNTTLQEEDRLTILGTTEGIVQLRRRFGLETEDD